MQKKHCKNGRALELSVIVSVAPGRLSRFTKIVRLFPKYILVNQLERPIRVWQDSSLIHSNFRTMEYHWRDQASYHHHVFRKPISKTNSSEYDYLFNGNAVVNESRDIAIPQASRAHRSALHITSAAHSECVPFHLPDTRRERQLRIDYGYNWYPSSSFPADGPGQHFLRMKRHLDPTHIDHITTRAAPQYDVVLPPMESDGVMGKWDGELGIWFETTWGQKEILVKGTKRGKYSFNNTDIHVGDQLVKVDGVHVKDFSKTMKLLKDRISNIRYQYAMRTSFRKTKKNHKNVFKLNILQQKQQNDALENPVRLVLTFRTIEERMRRVRKNATQIKRQNRNHEKQKNRSTKERFQELSLSNFRSIDEQGENDDVVSVEKKLINHSVFVILKPFDPKHPPYRIDNQAVGHAIYYRQRGCDGYAWQALLPGESAAYIWEEPMKPMKLSIRAAVEKSTLEHQNPGSKRAKKYEKTGQKLHSGIFHFVDNEEQGRFGPIRTIKLEEIGFQDELPCPMQNDTDSDTNLCCRVDTEGGTRVLVISDINRSRFKTEHSLLSEHLDTLRKRVEDEQEKQNKFQQLKWKLSSDNDYDAIQEVNEDFFCNDSIEEAKTEIGPLSPSQIKMFAQIESEANVIASDYPEGMGISRRNQVFIQVLEAVGLNSSDVSGLSNPYCKITFRKRTSGKKRHKFFRSIEKRRTYFVEKANNPNWSEQCFVFDVPENAVDITRGYFLQVKVFNFSFVGKHTLIGRTNVQLQSLRLQNEVEGWYPLTGRSRNTLQNSYMDGVRGSIRLRAHWIHSVPALVDYYILLSNRRLNELKRSKEGMKKQLSEYAISNQAKSRASALSLSIFSNRSDLRKKYMFRQKATRRRSPGGAEENSTISDKRFKEKHEDGKTRQKLLKTVREQFLSSLSKETAKSREKRYRPEEPPPSPGTESVEDGNALISTRENSLAKIRRNNTYDRLVEVAEKLEQSSALSPPASDSSGSEFKGILSNRRRSRSADFFGRRSFQHKHARNDFSPAKTFLSNLKGETRMSRIPEGSPFDHLTPLRHARSFDLDANVSISIFEINSEHGLVQPPSDESTGSSPVLGQLDFPITSSTGFDSSDQDHLQYLYSLGILYRQGSGTYFHRRHMTHYIHYELSLENSRLEIPRLPQSLNLLRNWTFAQVYLNDSEIARKFQHASSVKDSSFGGEKDRLETYGNSQYKPEIYIAHNDNEGKNDTNFQSSFAAAIDAIQIPSQAPSFMKNGVQEWAKRLSISRNSLSKAASRAQKSAINPGGRLTIRPITARNLSGNSAGMYVKLNFSDEVHRTKTVDAKIDPKWSKENEYQTVNLFDGVLMENDLQIHVGSLQTSGTLYLSIWEDRMKSDLELGILHIPISAALKCCDECISEYNDSISDQSASKGIPMYTRWFPLISPKCSLPVEGDMGLSTQPSESEKQDDLHFLQRFHPCIKLALIWEPDREVHDDSNQSAFRDSHLNSPEETLPIEENMNFQKSAWNYLEVCIGCLSAALIDSFQAQELLSFSATKIDIRYAVDSTKTRMGFAIGWLQIDHQADNAIEPVVLAPSLAIYPRPTLQILAVKDNLRSKGNTESFEFVGMGLQEFDIRVEEAWLFGVWNFFLSIKKRRDMHKKAKGLNNSDKITMQMKKYEVIANELFQELFFQSNDVSVDKSTSIKQNKKVYIRDLQVS